jgi:hypothetical protein
MTSQERKEKTRERVKRWKKANPYSLKKQLERRYKRAKEKKRLSEPVKVKAVKVQEKREPKVVQETSYVSLDSVIADPEVMREQEELARVYAGKRAAGVVRAEMEPEREVVDGHRGKRDNEEVVRIADGRADDQGDDREAAGGTARASGADVEIREPDGAEGIQQGRRRKFEELKERYGADVISLDDPGVSVEM